MVLLRSILPYFMVGTIIGIGVAELPFEYMPLIASSCLVAIIGFWLAQQTVRISDWRYMTLPGFLYLTYFGMTVLPAIYLYFSEGGLSRYRFVGSVLSGLLTLPLGFLAANTFFGFRVGDIKRYFASPVVGRSLSPFVYFGCLAGPIALTLLYLTEVETIPLMEMIRYPGETVRLAELREGSLSALDSPFRYAYAVLREMGYPFLISIALGYWLYTRQKKWLGIFIATLVIGLLYGSLSIAKGPVGTILMVVFVFVYLYKGGLIRRKTIVVWLALVLAFPGTVYLLTIPSIGLGGALQLVIGHRLLYAPALVAYKYFEIFPDEVGYLYGRGIGKLAWLIGTDYFNTGLYIARTIYPNAPESASAGGMFLASFHADFGPVGVVVGGVLTGMIVQGIQIYLLRQPKTVLNLAVYGFLFYPFWMLTSRGLGTVLLSTGVLFALVLRWVIRTAQSILMGSMGRAEAAIGVASRAIG